MRKEIDGVPVKLQDKNPNVGIIPAIRIAYKKHVTTAHSTSDGVALPIKILPILIGTQ